MPDQQTTLPFAALAFSALLLGSAMTSPMAQAAGDTPSPENAKVYFINLSDGDIVSSPFKIQFGLTGMGVAPAGVPKLANTGHHHLLVNTTLEGAALSRPLPADDQHRHFGKGQTETLLELPPGTHTLQLVLADWKHTPHNKPVMSTRISVTVQQK